MWCPAGGVDPKEVILKSSPAQHCPPCNSSSPSGVGGPFLVHFRRVSTRWTVPTDTDGHISSRPTTPLAIGGDQRRSVLCPRSHSYRWRSGRSLGGGPGLSPGPQRHVVTKLLPIGWGVMTHPSRRRTPTSVQGKGPVPWAVPSLRPVCGTHGDFVLAPGSAL